MSPGFAKQDSPLIIDLEDLDAGKLPQWSMQPVRIGYYKFVPTVDPLGQVAKHWGPASKTVRVWLHGACLCLCLPRWLPWLCIHPEPGRAGWSMTLLAIASGTALHSEFLQRACL